MKLMYSNLIAVLSVISGCTVQMIDDYIAEHGVTYCSMGYDGSGDDAPGETTSLPEPCSTAPDMTSTTTGETGESSSTGDVTTGVTTGLVAICGNGIVEDEETCDDMNDIPDDGCNNVCARDSVVFITSERYQANVNGLAGADQRCRMRAAIAGLPRFETYRAWLSTAEMPAADRIIHSRGRYVLVNGLVVAENWDALVSGTLLHPIEVDENSQTQTIRAWTGTLFDGTPAFGSEFCNDWTTSSGDFKGGTGISTAVDETWSFYSHAGCPLDLHLYCFEQ